MLISDAVIVCVGMDRVYCWTIESFWDREKCQNWGLIILMTAGLGLDPNLTKFFDPKGMQYKHYSTCLLYIDYC